MVACCVLAANAQTPAAKLNQLAGSAKVRRALDYLKATEETTINDQIKACEIPAPSFKGRENARLISSNVLPSSV
jgi:hypothetical protein